MMLRRMNYILKYPGNIWPAELLKTDLVLERLSDCHGL